MVATIAILALVAARRRSRQLSGPNPHSGSSQSSGSSLSRPAELVEASSSDPSTMVAETHSPHPWLAGLKLAIICGVLDAVANSLLLLGLRLGELTIMSVLTAMYSAGTIILAAIVLKERLTPSQVVGLVLALAAAAMLAVV
jgi:drug/metabolite transporter (DMT)-like permease